MRRFLFAGLAIALLPVAGADVRFDVFPGNGALETIGSTQISGGRLRLTPAKPNNVGAAWLPTKLPIRAGFETTFDFQITGMGGLGNGADGLAFVLQNSGPKAMAGVGGSAGFALGNGFGDPRSPGIPNTIAVFFDTYRNPSDPSDNYVAVATNGPVGQMRWPPPRLGMSRKLKTRLKDGKSHRARVVYKPPVMTVYLDDQPEPVLTAAVDVSNITDGAGMVWAGFTAATGAGWANHDILSWSFEGQPDVTSGISVVSSSISYNLAGCVAGKNLCTPEQPVVEQVEPGRFHVILPAHLEWGAAVPNASGGTVEIVDPRGSVCWDLEGRGAEGCNGPAGSASGGALVQRTVNGRTEFSVDDRTKSYADNQGYFEFDVVVR